VGEAVQQSGRLRSGQAVDAGVPLSDIVRDPRQAKLRKDDIPREVRHRWQACIDSSRDLRLRQWVRNVLAVYCADFDVQWSGAAYRYLTTPLRRPRPYKTNVLPARLSSFAARMVQTDPEWTAIPAGDSIADEEAAKFCEKTLRYAYREQQVKLARYFSVIQMALFGFGLLETYVDEEATVEPIYDMELDPMTGTPVFDEQSGRPIYKTDKDGRPRVTGVETRPGIKTRPVSPFTFVTPPGMEWPVLKDAPYVIRATWLSESYIRRRFDVPNDVSLMPDGGYGNYEAMTTYLWQVMNPQTLPVNRFENGKLLVLQYYEPARDADGYYEGKVYTTCGDHLIGDERSLFDDGRYPFFMFPWMPVTDSFYPFPWINPQIDPQNRIYQTQSHLMDHLARVGSPNIVADRGSGFSPKPVQQYRVYFTSPGMRRPEFMQSPNLPTGAVEMMLQSFRDLDNTGNNFPLARGESQAGVTSGLQVRLLQDADQTELGPIVGLHGAEFSRMGTAELDLLRNYGGGDRLLKDIGADQAPGYFEFKRARIPIGQQVIVQEESLLVHYRSALEERAASIGAQGGYGNLLTDPGAREKYRRAIRDPKMAGPLTPEEVQKQYLDQIHYRIIHEGQVPQVEPWWNLGAHRDAAQERLSRESLQWDETQKQNFMGYWQSVEEAIAKVEEEAAAQQKQMAEEAVALQAQVADGEANAKAKVEYLRGANKLALESMKQPGKAAGAGAGAAALSAVSATGSSNPPMKEGAA
jgi:hypothetical protein